MTDDGKDGRDDGVERKAPPPLPQPTLPTGGGALTPIGETYATNAQMGTAGLSIPLPLTGGRGGFGPALALAYDSGAGNGPFGIGWSIAMPAISRKTDRGLPRYPQFGTRDDDTFVFGGDDLVPVGGVTTNIAGEQVITYRPRIDSTFSRIERRLAGAEEYWVTFTKTNVRSVYGASKSARLSDPDDDGRVFRWHLEWSDDDRGNTIGYYYKPEDAEGIPDDRRFEATRPVANLYLHAIGWLNETPRPLDARRAPHGLAREQWPLLVIFDHGERDLAALARAGSDALAEGTWTYRRDAFSNRRSTFEIRTRRLCRNILMLHRITPDGRYDAAGAHTLVRSLELRYDEAPDVAHLIAVRLHGWKRRDDGTYEVAAFPATELAYTTAEVARPVVQSIESASLDDSSTGFDGNHARLLDLDGEGLPGVLSAYGSGWFYMRPNGPPLPPADRAWHPTRWTAPRRLAEHPEVELSTSELQDWNGDGALDVVKLWDGPRGVFVREARPGDRERPFAWRSFRAFAELPASLHKTDPELRFADLDGDGFPDAIISDDDCFRWYRAASARDTSPPVGYGHEERVPKRHGEPLFSNREESISFADMTGDGLPDLVRVTSGGVTYWPNLGFGRFGAAVTVRHAPVLAARTEFDPARVRFADFDGSGTADLVYLGTEAVTIYRNQAGNAFADAIEIPFAQPGNVQILDLWGRGTATIVWSSDLSRDRDRRVRYVDLFPDKPHLLVEHRNGHGLVRSIAYSTSTHHYLADRRADRPWITRLPFPVQVVDRVTTVDEIAQTRDVVSYRYHHGHYDGVEREFRGFAMVETRDTEDFGSFFGVSDADAKAVDRSLHRPPVVTRTWFHTGVFLGNEVVSRILADEYDRSDPAAILLPDTIIPDGATPVDVRELVRGLRGHTLRVEVFAEDAEPTDPASIARALRPYSTTETNFTLRLEVPASRGHAVVSVHPRETLSYRYDRDPTDPRVAHEVVTSVSTTGAIVDRVAIAYPRRNTIVDFANLTRTSGQGVMLATLDHSELRDVTDAELHRRDVVVREDRFELIGLPDRIATFAEVESFVAAADEHAYDPRRRLADRPKLAAGKHLLKRVWHRFSDDSPAQPLLPRGTVGPRALPARDETLAHTAATLAPILARDPTVDPSDARFGYVHDAEGWWAPTATVHYDVDAFFTKDAATNPFGGTQYLSYDPLRLAAASSTDAAGNVTTIATDYRVVQPASVRDPNGATRSVELDVRGIVVAIFVRRGADGGQTTAIDYEFYDAATKRPSRVHIAKFPDYRDGSLGIVEETWLYSDGHGREALRKVAVPPEPGSTTPRWIGTGRTVFDNKHRPLKKYEPYFATSEDYDPEDASARSSGVSAITRYDPLGRVVRVDMPDGTHTTTDYRPWDITSSDQIDTLDAGVPWYDTRLARPAGDPDRRAAERSFLLRASPTVDTLDPAGRAIDSSQDVVTDRFETSQEYDARGSVLAITDPRGIEVSTQAFDVGGRLVEIASADAGATVSLADATGKAAIVWRGDAADTVRLDHEYDRAERLTHVWVSDASVTRALRERIVYRDLGPSITAADAPGHVAFELDGAGMAAYEYDFEGRQTVVRRQVVLEHRALPAWNAAAAWDGGGPNPAGALLDGQVYASVVALDANARPVREVAPDGSVVERGYDRAGRLAQLAMVDPNLARRSIVDQLHYDEHGRPQRVEWGHQAITIYRYDPLTFRALQITTTDLGGQVVYQDLTYTYDPIGNITLIRDAAQDTLYFKNSVIRPEQELAYDAAYRIAFARGREHRGQARLDQRDLPVALRGMPIADPTDLAAIAVYTETYEYDAAGNLRALRHTHGSESPWVRTYDVGTASNRLEATHADTLDTTYTHDTRGNVTGMAHLADLQHTHRDQLWFATRTRVGNGTALVSTGAQPVYFAHDLRGQRVRKVSENGALVRERIAVGSWEVYREVRSGVLELERTTLHARDGASSFAILERLTDRSPDDGSARTLYRYHHASHNGSLVLELGVDRNVLSYEELHPFGTVAVLGLQDGVPPRRFHYATMERDEETGMQQHGVRHYAPWLGRWISPDPSGTKDGTNLYRATKNNPFRFVDLTGHQAVGEQYDEPPAGNALELRRRYDELSQQIDNGQRSDPDLERERERVKATLLEREKSVGTWSAESLEAAHGVYERNAQIYDYRRNSRAGQSCIVILNTGNRLAYGQSLPTSTESIEDTMKPLVKFGFADRPIEIPLVHGTHSARSGALEPDGASEDAWDRLVADARTHDGVSVYAFSISNGYHSVRLEVNANAAGGPTITWLDQTIAMDDTGRIHDHHFPGHRPHPASIEKTQGVVEFADKATFNNWALGHAKNAWRSGLHDAQHRSKSGKPDGIFRFWRLHPP